MKYYIATSLKRMDAHKKVKLSMEPYSYELAYDWTTHGSVKSESIGRLQEVAIAEIEGLAQADFVIVLLPGGVGTHTELGYAIRSGCPVFVHCESGQHFSLGDQTCAFYHHPQVQQLICPLEEVGMCVHAKMKDMLLST